MTKVVIVPQPKQDVKIYRKGDKGDPGEFPEINVLEEQTPPTDDSNWLMQLVDNTFKRLSWANIKASLKAYFDTIYQLKLGFDPNNQTDFLRKDGTFIAPIAGGGIAGQPLYMSNSASDIAGYKVLSANPDASEVIKTITAKESDGIVAGEAYLYPDPIGIASIPLGAFNFNYFRSISNASGDSFKQIEIFVRNPNGTEVSLVTFESSSIDDTVLTERSVSRSTSQSFTVDPTGRLGVRSKFRTTRITDTIASYIIGNGRGWYFVPPIAPRHDYLRDKNGNPDFQHLTNAERFEGALATGNSKIPILLNSITAIDKALSAIEIINKSTTDYAQIYGIDNVTNGYYKYDTGAFIANATRKSTKLDISSLKYLPIYVTASEVGLDTALVVYTDANNAYISYEFRGLDTTTSYYTKQKLTIPVNAKYALLTSLSNYPEIYVDSIIPFEKKYEPYYDLKKIDYDKIYPHPITWTTGSFINSTGGITGNSAFSYSNYIVIAGSSTYVTNAVGSAGGTVYAAFYDINKIWISSIQILSYSSVNLSIVTPQNTKYIRLSNRHTVYPNQYVTFGYLETLSSNVDGVKYDIANLYSSVVEIKKRNGYGWKPYDKAFFSFIQDDLNSQVGQFYDIISSYGFPMCFAAIPEYVYNVLPDSRVVKNVLDLAIANGGEVLCHGLTPITEASMDTDYYNLFVGNKRKLEGYGYAVNGIIMVGGTGEETMDNVKTDFWCYKYYKYSDRYGLPASVPYRIPRYRSNDFNYLKGLVDDAILNKKWVVFYAHNFTEMSQTTMEQLFSYIKTFTDSNTANFVNYKYMYDNYLDTLTNIRLSALEG